MRQLVRWRGRPLRRRRYRREPRRPEPRHPEPDPEPRHPEPRHPEPVTRNLVTRNLVTRNLVTNDHRVNGAVRASGRDSGRAGGGRRDPVKPRAGRAGWTSGGPCAAPSPHTVSRRMLYQRGYAAHLGGVSALLVPERGRACLHARPRSGTLAAMARQTGPLRARLEYAASVRWSRRSPRWSASAPSGRARAWARSRWALTVSTGR